ncbi:hypothetical protein [Corynebacterium kozikiae]|uniref:hypothetical protein n=1 Tax=Corynebacterium kozikiae TaxID=2968469 RepID=UPI00211CF5A2|nr:hypothetical protein [Corynebacterium sp. 76QC2CO]MCQ9343423.1 hypothetical protein [Corynebacterium sp. 76QC2CO]
MRASVQSASPKAGAASWFKVIAAMMASVLLVALSACAAQPQSGEAATEQAPLGTAYELGVVSAQGQQWPVRGQFYVPEGRSLEDAPLVIVNHLRYPNCTDDTFAHSCPGGEYRYDEGMRYLGEALAHEGYAVLIPDLGAVWEGGLLQSPYDQPAVWQAVVAAALEKNAPGYAPQEVGMVVHSRAAGLVNLGAQQFGVDSVFAYGPFYDTFDQQEFSPPAPDVPYLAIDSFDDQDVGPAAAIWMTQHITKDRTEPAYVATLNGYGHTLINQTLASAGKDDRVACDLQPCASVEEH